MTSQKKRNEQKKRWEYYLQERLAAGLPEKAVQLDPKLIARVYEFKDVKLVRPLPTKQFYPDLEMEDTGGPQQQNLEKNYIIKQKFGKNRNDKAPWNDPNPVKYGGKYGMITLRDKISETFQMNKKYEEER